MKPPLANRRVLHLNSLLTGGGTDDQCVKLVAHLRRRGWDAQLAGPAGRPFSRQARELDVPLRVTPPEGPGKLRFILAVAKLIRRERFPLVHGHHGRDIWPTILAARLSGARPKVVLTRHLAKSPASWPSRRFLLSRVDALIACSEFVAHVLREGHAEPDSPVAERRSRPPLKGDHRKIRVIYGGIDTDRFRPRNDSPLRAQWGLGEGDFAFGMVGGYDLPVGKGQREFLQAAARIRDAVPTARFLIVGRGNLAEVLREDIRKLGLEGRAWLTPYCTDMPAAMNALDCLVHAQIGTEAMPGVVCEAQACGRPVIGSDLDGVPEALAIGGLGRLAPPGNVEALAVALREQATASPPTPAERQAAHARVAARFSLPVSAARHAEFYDQLLGRPEKP